MLNLSMAMLKRLKPTRGSIRFRMAKPKRTTKIPNAMCGTKGAAERAKKA